MGGYNYGPYNYGGPPPPPGAPPPPNPGEGYHPTHPYQPSGYPGHVPPPQQSLCHSSSGYFQPPPPPSQPSPTVPPYSSTYGSGPYPSYSPRPSLPHSGQNSEHTVCWFTARPHQTLPTLTASVGVYDIIGSNGRQCKAGATLKLSIQYTPIDMTTACYQGVGPGPTGGRVTLYQVAHVPDGCLPPVPLEGGRPHVLGKCWLETTEAISQACKFIYITGRSFFIGNDGDGDLLLHGYLDVWVIEGKNLPSMEGSIKRKLRRNLEMTSPPILLLRPIRMICRELFRTCNPYVTFSVADAVLGRTFVISKSKNPVWNQHFHVPVAHCASFVQFMVKDNHVIGAPPVGTVQIPADQLYTGEKIEGVYDIIGSKERPWKAGATLKLSIQYIPMDKMIPYYQGVGPGPNYIGVPGTYFPLRKGGRVTLYQDAHVPDGCLPPVPLEGGRPHVHGKCWVDITAAISQARKFIYITGWSVYHNVQLVRDEPGTPHTLGELLKSKSQEGVRVLLLVWDDPTSIFKKGGFMQTHDEETREFFENSSVHVLLCPRSSGKQDGLIKQQETGLIYTHHQKTVIVDSDDGNNKRKVIAFVGGFDLCDGRYDTPEHPIFKTLKTHHKDDFHNPTFGVPSAGTPREPWHDLHTRIDGPAAYDVLQNFEERWLRASQPTGMTKTRRASEDALLRIERMKEIIPRDESPYLNDNDPETWHVQIFRSIDSNSVEGFPKDPREASSKNLVCGKNILVDMSIHTAYVKAIRSAQHFIYIENQYFLGSSFSWKTRKHLGANNLIPMEIALKIANKIKSNERFSVYIVIPMWPEGNPTDTALQRILLWQNKTMQMMYETIYKALVEAKREKEYTPQDYLNFFCLGNRETSDVNSRPVGTANTTCETVLTLLLGSSLTTSVTSSARAESSRRFMIYVHSKGMIVDDEYLIVGSANINDRSLEGFRDTEIAMGGYQPRHTWATNQSPPHGQIYAYRMSLWAEHTGVIEKCFENPSSLECMRRVRTMGEDNWKQFISDDVTEMTGHLLKYPVDVDTTGIVTPLAGCATFPDVGGNICGSIGILDVPENLTI